MAKVIEDPRPTAKERLNKTVDGVKAVKPGTQSSVLVLFSVRATQTVRVTVHT